METHTRERDLGTCLVNMVEFRVEFSLGPGMLKLDCKTEETKVFKTHIGELGSETLKHKSEKQQRRAEKKTGGKIGEWSQRQNKLTTDRSSRVRQEKQVSRRKFLSLPQYLAAPSSLSFFTDSWSKVNPCVANPLYFVGFLHCQNKSILRGRL